ncbi:MAG: S8 family serine peptidase [Microbacterium sp.]
MTVARPRSHALRYALLPALLLVGLVAPAVAAPAGPVASGAPAQVADELREAADAGTDPAAARQDSGTAAASATSADAPVEIVVTFDDAGVRRADQGDPARAASALQAQARSSIRDADAALSALEETGDVRVLNTFWITGGVLVSAKPTDEVLDALAALPGAVSVVPNFSVEPLESAEPVERAEPSVAASADETPVTYGLERIGAPRAWTDFDAEGQGVRVAVLDTGVDASHPDLAGRMVGSGLGDPTYPGSWISFDRAGNPIASRPSDPGSHGTHVAGTVVGGAESGTRIGVAPQAQLMAANVLSGSGGGSLAKILAGMQWAMDPFDANGDPAGRPADVINMSLGSSGYDETFVPIIRNLRQAGVFPAIAIGNDPCGPTGTSSPGDVYEAFAVGMTDSGDEVDPGSCGATTSWPSSVAEEYGWPDAFVKPDASAPGTAVFSSMPGGVWVESTGTSMATPHVAGAVALIRSAQAGLSVDRIAEALETTAWRPDDSEGPDAGYGHGRIDVHAAVASVLGESGVHGVIRDAETGEAVAGATVAFDDRGETWTTDEQGRFTARLEPGTYTFTATRFGYEDATSAGVVVDGPSFATTTMTMTPITVGALRGSVADSASGDPVAGARVQVVGQEITTTTGDNGAYRIDGLPAGEYRLRVTADGYRESVSDPAEVRAALTTRVDYRLAKLQRALVLGDNGERTSALLGENGFAAESRTELTDDVSAADYDVVVWDAPRPVDDATLRSFVDDADAAGTGVVWLDLGASANSGIAQLGRATGSPGVRESANDRSLAATGYRVVADHEIFQGGALSTEAFGSGDVIIQNEAENGPKYYAWFEDLTGGDVTVLADVVTLRDADDAAQDAGEETPADDPAQSDAADAPPAEEDADAAGSEGADATEAQAATRADEEITRVGSGIAIAQRGDSRNAFLSLHGSSPAVDVRTWSMSSTQLFLNTLTWAAPEASRAPDPDITVPEPPTEEPGKPGGGSTSPDPTSPKPGAQPPSTPGGGATGGSTLPAATSPDASKDAASEKRGAEKAKSAKSATPSAPKPNTAPDAPVDSIDDLTGANDGGLTVRIEDDIASVTVPGADPGDWFFLHVYPSKTPVDWIRVDDEGELRIDIGRMGAGEYRFAFTDEDGALTGWVEVVIEGEAVSAGAADDPPAPVVVDEGPQAALPTTPTSGLSLTPAEQLMLLGAGLLILAAAALVLLSSRRKPQAPGGAA